MNHTILNFFPRVFVPDRNGCGHRSTRNQRDVRLLPEKLNGHKEGDYKKDNRKESCPEFDLLWLIRHLQYLSEEIEILLESIRKGNLQLSLTVEPDDVITILEETNRIEKSSRQFW
jgi:hypothetical protein